ncbi:MAG TPA: tetratricopeptide repeat protein [Rhizomicrobium sp.]|nr:tetratricopeptide repeat protein [Rhizomicrobium sp.]
MDLQQVYNQARQAQTGGNLVEAALLYREILNNFALPEVMVNYANVLAKLGRHGEALAQYDQALKQKPEFFEALYNRGNLYLETNRAPEALDDYERVVAIRADAPGVWNNRGTALRRLRRLEEALASYERAVALAPGHINAHTNRAIALFDLARLDEALAAADAALAVQADFAEALYVKGNILRDLGRLAEARACFEQTLQVAPGHGHALNGLAQMTSALCDWDGMAALMPRLGGDIQAGRSLIQPFVMMGYTEDAALLRRCAENYVHRMAPAQPPLVTGRPYRHDRIRLAYLSADFHTHPTAQLMAELFERHDRARFEVSAFAFGPDDNSAMRHRLAKAFDHFENVRRLSELEIARLLKAREIDIAVDLNGHTHEARPGIFSHRAAPVQVNYLVYPGTTGASYMDYILADRIVLPLDQQPFFSEKIVHLPDCYQANDASRALPPAPSRREAGLPDEGFIFCCFNNSWKITAPLFDIWMRLLQKVPGSVLWLLDSAARDQLRAHATARGIGADRLIFAPRLSPDRHLARHQPADLFLDTLPYNAHTTCSDALWAGLPMVTCHGKAFQARVAASLLKAIDLPELVTTRLEDYEALALELAVNPALLQATKDKLRRNRATTPLYDSERFRKNIEAAYEAMLAGY